MLVLTRKSGEAIVIGDSGEVVVTILDMNESEVRIAIEGLEKNRAASHDAVPIEVLSESLTQHPESLRAGEAA